MSADTKHADNIRQLVEDLNDAVSSAARQGLSVDYDVLDITGVADRCRVARLDVKISKAL